MYEVSYVLVWFLFVWLFATHSLLRNGLRMIPTFPAFVSLSHVDVVSRFTLRAMRLSTIKLLRPQQ